MPRLMPRHLAASLSSRRKSWRVSTFTTPRKEMYSRNARLFKFSINIIINFNFMRLGFSVKSRKDFVFFVREYTPRVIRVTDVRILSRIDTWTENMTERIRLGRWPGNHASRAYRSPRVSLFFVLSPPFPFFFYFRRDGAKDPLAIGGVAKRSPGGRCPCTLARGGLAGKREIGMCGGRRDRCTHVRPGYTRRTHPLSLPLSLWLSSVYPFQVGGAANQSFLREHDGRRR